MSISIKSENVLSCYGVQYTVTFQINIKCTLHDNDDSDEDGKRRDELNTVNRKMGRCC